MPVGPTESAAAPDAGTMAAALPLLLHAAAILLLSILPPTTATAADTPSPRFTDVTHGSGIAFRHVHGGGGPRPRRYYIETMGSGLAFLDYDVDGWPDLYLVNGQHTTDEDAPRASNALYRNRGDGTFASMGLAAGVADTGYGMGVTAGDVDNDGDPDLYVTNYGANSLYLNGGDGTFGDITAAAGVGDPGWGVGCAFLDYDNDGDLDLYVANYLEYALADADRELRPYLARGQQSPTLMGYPHPDNFHGQPDVLYRNDGRGRFTDVTRQAGVFDPTGKGMGIASGDYDDDGDADIFVANDQTANFLLQNRGDGTFGSVGLLAGVAYDHDGRTQSGMGADFGDFDQDGDLDLFMTDYQAETNALYVNEGGGFFTDRASAAGLGVPSLPYVSWAAIFLDYDNDGFRDLFVANGHVLDNAELFDSSSSYYEPNQLFHNRGPDRRGQWRFSEVGADAGLQEPAPSRGAAAADYDNDGDVDLAVLNSNLPAQLLRNDGGNRLNWLQVRLLGQESNRDGIGARVRVHTAGATQLLERHSSSGYLSQNEARLCLGLGGHSSVDSLVVRWPSGLIDVARDVPANQCVTVVEGVGLHPVQAGRLPD
jgi:enediyne biosynthesis protein E4